VKDSVVVIIPAFNEEEAIGKVLAEIPPALVDEVVVVDNGSTDQTSSRAREAGATVVQENRKGYGIACLKGIAYFTTKARQPDIVVFLDADHSDHPEEMARLISPIIQQGYELVIGSRVLGKREAGSMTPPQLFGNWLATRLMRVFFNASFTDLGPFRAIKWQSLLDLNMQDTNFGWTVEMQIKAIRQGLKYTEVPVTYRKRKGVSKISGTVSGTLKAGYKILYTIFKYA
jgi:glycosyltransferase involved in cell wall biosynthesis